MTYSAKNQPVALSSIVGGKLALIANGTEATSSSLVASPVTLSMSEPVSVVVSTVSTSTLDLTKGLALAFLLTAVLWPRKSKFTTFR